MAEALLPIEEARARILAGLVPLDAQTIALEDAPGRVLAAPVHARRASPPVAVSSMDGYAVFSGDAGIVPAELAVSQTIAAGAAAEPLAPGTAARIFTGAAIPLGADSVVLQEDAEARGGRVLLKAAAKPGAFIRPAGFDFGAGAQGLFDGQTLTARDIGVAAAMNVSHLAVRRRPRVAVLATGDELVPPGGEPAAHQIIASSVPALAAALTLWGADVVHLGLVRDDERAIAGAIQNAPGADLLLALGGASVGDHDLVQRALTGLAFSLGFWKIAMRPGKPMLYGRLGALPVLGLPGNPVSTMICALIFVRPMVRSWLGARRPDGRPDLDLPERQARLASPLAANGPRADFLRGRLAETAGDLPLAEAFPAQDSAQLLALARADCLIPRTPFAPHPKREALIR